VYYRAESGGAIEAKPINLRCPSCGQMGSFGSLGQRLQIIPANVFAGLYACPNTECFGLIYIVTDPSNKIVTTHPAELIDFDATNIPTEVREALEEAIECHSHESYIAGAIMVRKTLEELCRERGATGDNLKERIEDLGSKVVLPKELLDGLDDLRLLGNDAAHIESRVFNEIGLEEVEVGIEFAKEVLKAVYQYSELLARLRALKAQTQ
jgi:hypothetical protein